MAGRKGKNPAPLDEDLVVEREREEQIPLNCKWISEDLLAKTQNVWGKYLGRPVPKDEAMEMLLNMKRIADAFLIAGEDDGPDDDEVGVSQPAPRTVAKTAARPKDDSAGNRKEPENLSPSAALPDRALLMGLYKRENGCCFYCLKSVSEDDAQMDQLVPADGKGQVPPRSMAIVCRDCCNEKQNMPAADYLRKLYRDGVLSRPDLADRLAALTQFAEPGDH